MENRDNSASPSRGNPASGRRLTITSNCNASSKKSPNSNGSACGRRKCRDAEGLLHRLIRYAEKVFDLSGKVLDKVTDTRQQPRTPTTLILKSALALFWARLGSLNALETISAARFWRQWLGGAMISADTMGCLLYTSDAADDLTRVDLGGRS